MRHARIDEARLLDAGDDFYRMAERLARTLEEARLAPRLAQRIGPDHAHRLRAHCPKPLAEALQRGDGAVDGILVEAPLRIEAGGEADHLAQPVDDRDLAVRVARDDHVKAVRTEVDGRKDVGYAYRCTGHESSCGTAGEAQAANEDPQPQVVLAFGFLITNCAPSSPSR